MVDLVWELPFRAHNSILVIGEIESIIERSDLKNRIPHKGLLTHSVDRKEKFWDPHFEIKNQVPNIVSSFLRPQKIN